MPTPFVGRAIELDVLRRTVERAGAPHPSAAIIIGEPGSGKTSLVLEAARRWAVGRLVRATGFEPMQSIQLAAASELLRRLVTVPGAGAALERLVFGPAVSHAPEPLRVFEAAHRALSGLDAIVLVVDDLQWFDERSLALLQYLLRARGPAQRRFAIIAAARPSAAALALRDAIRAELPPDRSAVIELGPLSLDDGRLLVRTIDQAVDDAAATELWRSAQGSPFWLEALARRRGGRRTASVIEDRLRALTAEASDLLAILAVAARPMPAQDIARGPGQLLERVRHAARELSTHGLAIESTDGIRTAHDLIRDEVVRLLPAGVRRRIDGSLATLLEALAGEDAGLLVEALEHRVASGLPAADLTLRLLTAPNRRLLGAANLRLAAVVSDTLPPGSAERLEVDAGIATLAAAVGEQELALDRWDRVARLRDAGPQQARAEIEAARAAVGLTRREEAHEHVDRARAARPESVDLAVELDALEAQIELWLDHRTAAGSRRAGRALRAAREMATMAGGIAHLDIGARRAYLAALQAGGDSAMQEDRCHDMAMLADEAILVAQDLGDEWPVAAMLRSGLALRHLLLVIESESRFRTAWDTSKRLVLPALAVEAGHGLCQSLRDLGRLEEARVIGVAAAELEARLQVVSRHWVGARAVLHSVELYLGETASALQALRRDAEDQPDPHFRLAIHEAIAHWQARYVGTRGAAEVEWHIDQALGCARQARCPRCNAELSLVGAEALARAGRTARARRLLQSAHPDDAQHHAMREMWASRAAAAIAVADGNTAAAGTALEELITNLERRGLLLELAWAQIDLGRVLSLVDRQRAVHLLTAAAACAERTGARSQGRLVARELRRLGVRAWRRGPATSGDALASLSRREREVVEHVAEGRSNAEIADALLVSPKTVERHVSNVLAKLSLRNRTEVAALARSRGTGFPR